MRVYQKIHERMLPSQMIPNKEGWYNWTANNDHNIYDVEVYEGPNGELCVWCKDIGASQYEQVFTVGDEMCGHIPVQYLGGTWIFLGTFEGDQHGNF